MINRKPLSPGADTSLKRKRNFLLVDDDPICIFIHSRILELSTYCNHTMTASNGKKALEILHQASATGGQAPDIILLDVDMPLMNGLEFLEAFQRLNCANKERIKIVLLTSSVSKKDLDYAMTLGVAQCLSKPLTSEALDAIVNSLSDPDELIPVMCHRR